MTFQSRRYNQWQSWIYNLEVLITVFLLQTIYIYFLLSALLTIRSEKLLPLVMFIITMILFI